MARVCTIDKVYMQRSTISKTFCLVLTRCSQKYIRMISRTKIRSWGAASMMNVSAKYIMNVIV